MLEQPRWKDGEAPQGFLNIAIEDIPLDVSEEAKRNILKACNECSLLGYANNREYAALLDAETGEAISVDGIRLIKGERDWVDVSLWETLIVGAKELSLISVHNHTNATSFSERDIVWFLLHPEIISLLVIAGDRIYSITKQRGNKVESGEFLKTVGKYLRDTYSKDEWGKDTLLKAYKFAANKYEMSMEVW